MALVKPHGGFLVQQIDNSLKNFEKYPHIQITDENYMDAEQIAIGAFSPLKGFMIQKDYQCVVDTMKLSDGTVWPLPIVLDIDEETKNKIDSAKKIILTDKKNNSIAIMNVSEIFIPEKEKSIKKIFGTLSDDHPGVVAFKSLKKYFIGGEITLLKRRESTYKAYELTPHETRNIFSERGWLKIVGFHTRNVMHRSHEFIQKESVKKVNADGIFLQPVIGKKKSGDFEASVIIESYTKLMPVIYPDGKAVFATWASYSRYAGPREAIFTALVRKNFGCSHFIVGRDHTGVKNFYAPDASHKIFDSFSSEELGITPIKFDKVFYSTLNDEHLHGPENPNHPEEKKKDISGTEAREMFKSGKSPPEWFMRKEVSEIILNKIKNGERVFVE